jgi:ABC-type sugar transport system substrate-binding protein
MGKVANLQGLLGQGLNRERSGGWKEIMEQYPDIEVSAMEPTNWDPKKAVEITENWLVAYPDLDLIYGNSDGLTVPAAETVDKANKLWDGKQGVIITSVDGSDYALEAVRDGKMVCTFLYAPQHNGFWKVWAPYRIIHGETIDVGYGPNMIKIKGALVTPENVDTMIQLAEDQKQKIETFTFEKTLPEILADYLGK